MPASPIASAAALPPPATPVRPGPGRSLITGEKRASAPDLLAEEFGSHWPTFEKSWQKNLIRFERGGGPAQFHGRSLEEMKQCMEQGRSARSQRHRRRSEAGLQQLAQGVTDRLLHMKSTGVAPRAVLLMVDGADATKKSSSSQRIVGSFTRAGYNGQQAAFKAPSAADRARHWLARYTDKLPTDGAIMHWDRSPAGDYAYVPGTDQAILQAMARDFNDLEEDLAKKGILVIKILTSASQEKRASVLGKRMFRSDEAAAMVESGRAENPQAMAEIKQGIGRNDILSLGSYPGVMARFGEFTAATERHSPWIRLDTSDPAMARTEALIRVRQRLN